MVARRKDLLERFLRATMGVVEGGSLAARSTFLPLRRVFEGNGDGGGVNIQEKTSDRAKTSDKGQGYVYL
jgi:hypothetical protein